MKSRFFMALVLTSTYLSIGNAQQYPIMDKIAAKIVQKYQSSSCEELWQKKGQEPPPSPEEQKTIQLLKGDPQLRTAFINKIVAPIANKMFECGMIP
jgi:hypothetical protein